MTIKERGDPPAGSDRSFGVGNEVEQECRRAIAVEVHVLFHGRCNASKVVGRKSGGNHQNSFVGFAPAKKFAGEDHVIVAVPCDDAPLFGRRVFELFAVRKPLTAHLVDADSVYAELPKGLRDPGTEILVQEQIHRASLRANGSSAFRPASSCALFSRMRSSISRGYVRP